MKREILTDNIVVYRNAIPDKEQWLEDLKNSKYWQKWYDVGQQIQLSPKTMSMFTDFPSEDQWADAINGWKDMMFFDNESPERIFENLRLKQIEDIFYKTTKDYISMFPLQDMPNWHRGGSTILRYDAKKEGEITTEASGTISYALPFHTDFDQNSRDEKGLKPKITVTMYLNDNYEGGDIEYRVFDKTYSKMSINGDTMIDLETGKIVEGFNYKPQAGDVIIFPSDIPYYHGVKRVTKGQKIFIRTFWMYDTKTT